MKKNQLLQNPKNVEALSILAMSPIPALEKELWLEVLPTMTDDEKDELVINLKREMEYAAEVSESVARKFLASFEK